MIRLMVFIDGTWLYSNLRHLAREADNPSFYIDYGILCHALKNTLENRDGVPHLDLVRTFLFGSYPVNYDVADEERAQRRKDFFSLLREDYSYEVESYPVDYQGRHILHDDRDDEDHFTPREKCVDIALASSVLYNTTINSFDLALLIVGDKDYYPMLQKARALGKRIAIASIRQSCARMYSDKIDKKHLRDFPIIWLNDMLDDIAYKPVEVSVECKSPLHEGSRDVRTTIRLRAGQPFFCDDCRTRFAEQKAEQMANYENAANGEKWADLGEPGDGMQKGIIENLKPDRGFGFIRREDGASFFFHLTSLVNAEWNSLDIGMSVRFAISKMPDRGTAGSAIEVTVVNGVSSVQ